MFTEQTRRNALAVAEPPSHRDARALVEATVRDVLASRPQLRSVRWVQTVDDPDPNIFIVSKVIVEFTSGATFNLDTAKYDGPGELDLAAFAILADLVLAQADILVDAFGLGVSVIATREGVEVTHLTS